MSITDIPSIDNVELIKKRFGELIEELFNYPLSINRYVAYGYISKNQAKQIRNNLNTLNYYTCLCCRKFDKTKLIIPVEEVLEPIIDIAKKSLQHQ